MATYKLALQTEVYKDIEGFFVIEQTLLNGEESVIVRLNADQAKWLSAELNQSLAFDKRIKRFEERLASIEVANNA